MFNKIIHFLKYNNATIIILAIVLIIGGGALAAGPENIGQKQSSIQGIDNTLLLSVDLSKFNMDFKIENIEQDEKYYYVVYNYLDIVIIDNAWQYQLNQRTQKISKKIKQDIGEYMAKFLAKHYESRIRELKEEKIKAQTQGETKRVEVTEYSGLVGITLDLAATVFPGYDPIVKKELPTPENFDLPENNSNLPIDNSADNLTQIYNDYVNSHPDLFNEPTPSTSEENLNTQTSDETIVEPENQNSSEDAPTAEPTDVNIIELPEIESLPLENTTTESASEENSFSETTPSSNEIN